MSFGQRLARLRLQSVFGLLGLVFLAVAFRNTWARSPAHLLPGLSSLAAAELLALVSLAGAARGWVCLFEGRGRAAVLAEVFYTSQLGKYVPGAVWQAVGQVSLSSRGGVTLGEAATAFPVHALTQVAAGGTVGAALAVLGTALPAPLRAAALLGLLLVLPLHRASMVRVVGWLARFLRWRGAVALPSQPAIVRSWAWGVWTLVWGGAAFALLAGSVQAARPPAAAVPAFALSWTVGFLAVPFPSGIGVREAVLIATVYPPSGAAAVIAASTFHRLVTMLGELVMIVASRIRLRMQRRREQH